MKSDFFTRLGAYYRNIAETLKADSKVASIFPNTTDIGMSRERIYADFLKSHAPTKCNVFFGGFLFDDDGNESKQLDIIVSTDTAPRFDFNNKSGDGKSFSPVEGTLCAVSIKSQLNKNELFDALGGIASIPATKNLNGRLPPYLKIHNYDDWPLKIIFASNGISVETLKQHISEYYTLNPSIPLCRRPDFIHVAGSYFIFRSNDTISFQPLGAPEAVKLPTGIFHETNHDSDMQAIVWTLTTLQERAMLSSQILFSYGHLINEICNEQRMP